MQQPRFAVVATALACALLPGPAIAAGDDAAEVDALVLAFAARTGAQLVFTAADLPDGDWFDIKVELPADRRADAARIALAEAKKYPRGYLKAIGLRTLGVFDGLASKDGDGFRPWNKQLGGYRYFGQWNGSDAVIAAFYTDEQLPLTIHHEVFHHIDSTVDGVTTGDAYDDDNARFDEAVAGDAPYPAATISKTDLAALGKRADGSTLDDAVSDYAAKSPNEDQAETARHLMTNLPDALVQIARQPELAGSQRILHVIDQYTRSAAGGPDVAWLVDLALDRDPAARRGAGKVSARAAKLEAALRERVGARDGDRTFTVHGKENADGVNKTLRADIARFGKTARTLIAVAKGVDGAGPVVAASLVRDLRLLARYHRYIGGRWSISAGTERSFQRARKDLLAGIRKADAALAGSLRDLELDGLADAIAADGTVTVPATPVARDNPYLDKVDAEISDQKTRAAIRAVQPAAVRLGGGSGVNLDSRGVILTAGHVVDKLGARLTVTFPDGTEVEAVTTAYDATLDLAVLEVDGGADLPWAPLAPAAPAVGSTVVIVGQPGTWTPDGDATNYQPWHVSSGEIRGFRGDPLDDQSLGGTKHDAWTYWGHSGSPLFDSHGRIVALHNSWDSTTAMRHAVTYEAIIDVLDRAGASYHVAR